MLFEVGQLQALDLGLGGCQVRIRASSPVPTPARGKANSPRSMLPGLALPNCLGEGQGQLSLLQEAAKEKPSQLSSAQVSSPLGYVHGPRCQPRLPMSKWPLLVTGPQTQTCSSKAAQVQISAWPQMAAQATHVRLCSSAP